ncbi:hypothetical protein HHL21_07295 [Massilia sp. RP-1-19]|uniref:Uncharacterized protein n=1 Tax=Massilia polaris TaxID=2728846 RepID=A0A848HIK6_9BURK|nr:hypothetical protein [Massilia polaris]NML60892.1 hypothetical protein [Massilia polaris]
MGIFRRRETEGVPGVGTVALRVSGLAPGCIGVACDGQGATRRIAPGSRTCLAKGELLYCFHPGPYTVDLVPFAAAPEAGLRLVFVVDAPDPRVAQQRFDLFLASEAGERLELAGLRCAIEQAIRRELVQGNIELPPCATLGEWDAFRAGVDELLYMRFGVTVEDCMPADVGDYAALLKALPSPGNQTAAPVVPELDSPGDDAHALRRLFLELPRLTSALRLVAMPPGLELFRQHQALLRRLDQVSMSVATMPALELAAPGQRLDLRQQVRRTRHSVLASKALDEAWALLARIRGGPLAAVMDDFDRIVANLEHASAARRSAEGEAP